MAKAKEQDKVLTQPTAEEEQEEYSMMHNEPSLVKLRDKEVKVYWLHNETKSKITKIFLEDVKEDEERKVLTKAAAAILLDSPNCYWTLTFMWGLCWKVKWRWMYYIKGYSDAELLPIIAEGKKKVPLAAYLTATMLLQDMRETIKMMSRKEVRAFQAAQLGAQLGQQGKSTTASQNAEPSSE